MQANAEHWRLQARYSLPLSSYDSESVETVWARTGLIRPPQAVGPEFEETFTAAASQFDVGCGYVGLHTNRPVEEELSQTHAPCTLSSKEGVNTYVNDPLFQAQTDIGTFAQEITHGTCQSQLGHEIGPCIPDRSSAQPDIDRRLLGLSQQEALETPQLWTDEPWSSLQQYDPADLQAGQFASPSAWQPPSELSQQSEAEGARSNEACDVPHEVERLLNAARSFHPSYIFIVEGRRGYRSKSYHYSIADADNQTLESKVKDRDHLRTRLGELSGSDALTSSMMSKISAKVSTKASVFTVTGDSRWRVFTTKDERTCLMFGNGIGRNGAIVAG